VYNFRMKATLLCAGAGALIVLVVLAFNPQDCGGDVVRFSQEGELWKGAVKVLGETASVEVRSISSGANDAIKERQMAKRDNIADSLEFRGGGRLLGKISVLQSDLLEFENGEIHRHSVVADAAGRRVFAVEKFDGNNRFMYAKFYRANKITISFADKKTLMGMLRRIEVEGYDYRVPFDWEYYPIVEVKTETTTQDIFNKFTKLSAVVGKSGRVFLVEVEK
jgi:hypothetical protein